MRKATFNCLKRIEKTNEKSNDNRNWKKTVYHVGSLTFDKL